MIHFDDYLQVDPQAEERVSQEEMAALSLHHAEEIRKIQEEFG